MRYTRRGHRCCNRYHETGVFRSIHLLLLLPPLVPRPHRHLLVREQQPHEVPHDFDTSSRKDLSPRRLARYEWCARAPTCR
jgi:hypothetical protein